MGHWRKRAGYGAVALCMGVLHNVVLLYHYDAFMFVFRMSQPSFVAAELAFLVYNSVNDFLLSWISDSRLLGGAAPAAGAARVSEDTLTRRIRSLQLAGPMMAVSFLLFWLPWGGFQAALGLVFGLLLCLYDTFLTAVELNHSALLADLTTSESERVDLNVASSICSALGSGSVFLSFLVWDRSNLWPFRLFAMALAALAAVGFVISTRIMREFYLHPKKLDNESLPLPLHNGTALEPAFPQHAEHSHVGVAQAPSVAISSSALSGASRVELRAPKSGRRVSGPDAAAAAAVPTSTATPSAPQVPSSMAGFLLEMLRSHNFRCFAVVSLVQVLNCHFLSNTAPLLMSVLLAEHLPPAGQSVVLGLSFTLPHINNLFFSRLVKSWGSYSVIRLLLLVKLGLAVTMSVVGLDSGVLLVLYLGLGRVFTEGVCKLLNLVISDLVDEDYVRHRRSSAISALIFGTTALLSKPGQTIAPLIATWIISRYCPDYAFRADSAVFGIDEQAVRSASNIKDVAFYLAVYVPMACAAIQILAWSQFTLRGAYLKQIRLELPRNQRTVISL